MEWIEKMRLANNKGDNRTLLTDGHSSLQGKGGLCLLSFPGMDCTIERCIGRGSNALVYLGYYQDHYRKDLKHQILIKELFPFDPTGGIYRGEDGNIIVDSSVEKLYLVHRRSFENANAFHLKMLENNPGGIDSNINTYALNNTLYSILEFTGGRSLLEEITTASEAESEDHYSQLSLEKIICWMKGILLVLKTFHEAGYLHLDISLDNILLIGEGENERITIIDYNSIISLEDIRNGSDLTLSIKQEYAAPEVFQANRSRIGISTDLYSVTAVFFHLLFGRGRTPMERVRQFVMPEIGENNPLAKELPIVVAFVEEILRKGLKSSATSRYQSADEMLRNLDELVERIHCRGITQWALWQKGRNHADEIVRRNTALRYITDQERLYPLHAQKLDESGKRLLLTGESFYQELQEQKPVLLLGSGGMGKTTALLHLAYSQPRMYRNDSTAVMYISLYEWKNGDRSYIQDKILNYLDFSHTTMESARKELRKLLSHGMQGSSKQKPRLLLCIDGLNEANGDISPLLDEIQDLSGLPGVRLILTSRSEIIAGTEYEKWMLCAMEPAEVYSVLEHNHIPIPDRMDVMELLHIPMMLSMYVQALDGRKTLKMASKEELLQEYLSVLTVKEAREYLKNPDVEAVENSKAYLGAQVAVKYVLPEIARLLNEKKRSLTERELFECVEGCYRNLDRRAFTLVFETWIGHIADLRMGTDNADEWYGKVVQEILWKKMGLLVKNEENCYHISHQILEEYFKTQSDGFHRAFSSARRKLRNRRMIFSAAAVLTMILALGFLFRNMNVKVQQQSQESQINESHSLAQESENRLKEGDRSEAVRLALQALPDENNDRPYTVEAEKALTAALYLYKKSGYYPTHRIDGTSGVWKYAMSENGNYLVTLDAEGYVMCYDFRTEQLLWSIATDIKREDDLYSSILRGGEQFVELVILEEMQTVAIAGESGSAFMYTLARGELVWEITYSEMEPNLFGEISQFTISNNEKVLAIAFQSREEENGSSVHPKKIAFYDSETGKRIATAEDLLVSDSLYCNFIGRGAFSDDDTHYAAMTFNEGNGCYDLISVDTATGQLHENAWMRRDTLLADRMATEAYITYLSENDVSEGGWMVSVLAYDQNVNTGYDACWQMGLFTEGSEQWNFIETYQFDYAGISHPFVFRRHNQIELVFDREFVRINDSTGMVAFSSEKMESDVILCREENEQLLLLFFANGDICEWSRKNGEKFSLKSQIALGGTFQDAGGSAQEGNPIVLSFGSDGGVYLLCEYLEDSSASIEFPALCEVSAYDSDGSVYSISDKEEFLYLTDESAEGSSYQAYGTIFDPDGNILDQFEFSCQVGFVTDLLHMSGDGRYLVGDKQIYDLEMHELISMEEVLTKGLSTLDLKSIATESGFLSVCVGKDTLSIWENGVNLRESSSFTEVTELSDEKEIKLSDIKGYEQSSRTEFEPITIGENGLVILGCRASDRDEPDYEEGDPVDYFLAYSLEEDRWNKIDNPAEGPDFPYISIAKETDVFAAVSSDHTIRIYDSQKNCMIAEYPYDFDRQSIKDAEFILDDTCLLLLTVTGEMQKYVVLRISDGKILFSYSADGSKYSKISFSEDGNLLFLYDSESNRKGICVDTDSWTIIYEVEGLRGIMNQKYLIVQNEFYDLKIYRRYSLEEMIGMVEQIVSP